MQEYCMFFLLSLSAIFLQNQVVDSQRAPVWTDVSGIARSPDGRFKGFSESTLKGTIVAQVQAVDPQGGPIKYTIGGDVASNLEINEASGEIKLVAPFDFERQATELTIVVRATDTEGLYVPYETSISIFDANDNPPVFTNPDTGSTYFNANPPENTAVNTTIFNILVNDVDYAQPPLDVYCDVITTAERARACEVFRLVVTANSNRNWRGRLVLQQPLDYETEQSYTVRIIATDSNYSSTQELQVGIRDVNDSPPRFTRAIGVVLPENQPVGTLIETVIAEDTDKTEKRPIYYELFGDPEALRYFMVNSTTGVITNVKELDYEDPARVPGQRFMLDFRAREILQAGPPPTLGNDSVTTATAQISVLITDINDNCPLFDQSSYQVEIQENIPQGSNIPLQMTVTDRDSGDRASFNLNLQPFSNIFGVRPTFGSSPASITIAVSNSSALDFESSQITYSLTVQAIPSTGQPVSCPNSQASVLILLKDVNDNYPAFTQTEYQANVREDAGAGTSVLTVTAVDRDSEYMGQKGLVYSLSNDGSHLFNIDAGGYITVNRCTDPGPGRYRCIDYEASTRYDLTVRAVDNRGVSPFLAGSAPLTIHIMDVNDNVPELPQSYIRYIREGETHTTDRLQLQAVDRDSNVLTYSILPNQPEATLWTLNATADIYATRPIVYRDLLFPDRGSFIFQVQASDGTYTASATVTIFVIDVNDKVPYCFPQANMTRSIRESISANTFVTQLTVTDEDSPATGNGMVDVSIDDGSLGKFVVQPSGSPSNNQYFFNINTSPDATFDFDIKNTYLLLVKARDRGSPSNTGTCYVTINIDNDNNRNPYIDPPSQSVSVYENAAIGTGVFDVAARDLDVGAVLKFRFGTNQVCYQSGQQVAFRDLFAMDENGHVTVKNKLDRNMVDFLSYDIIVRDISASTQQEGQGVLYIRILEYNDQNPQFESQFYNFSILEERPLSSFVGSVVATDEDDQIASYLLLVNPGNLIAIGLNSGVLRVNGRLDYEKQHNVTLTAQALDTGSPSLDAQTTVFINIININDNTPVFGQLVYQIHVPENTYLSGEVLRVSATDGDEEDYGVVRYSLTDSYFNIDNITGTISMVSQNVKLDRESQAIYTFLVIAYDSPNHPSERLTSTVPVYVIVDDVNDNCPEFTQGTVFSGNVIETADVGDQVIEIYATDKDTGTNSDIVFSIENSSLVPMFEIKTFRSTNDNTRSGRVLVKESLRKRPGVYNFTVVASDMGGTGNPTMCSRQATVIITVQEAINDAPVWIRPPISNYSIEVLESQYRGMLVYDCKASDINPGDRGIIDYSFNVVQQLVQNTSEFRVNPITCIIRAEIVFDREQVDTYALTLVAKDRGDPSARSETVLIVRVLDVNDNYPEFPTINGETIPYSFRVPEGVNATTAGIIGKVSATDKDSTNPNNLVFYKILAGNDDGWFILNRTSGEISLNPDVAQQGLDREKTGSYSMDILAYNDVNDDSVIRNRRRRSTNPSIVTVSIEVTDINDTPPSFTSMLYFGCISIDARYGQSVVTVQALDADIDRAQVMQYSKISETTGNNFSVDRYTGVVRNSQLLYGIWPRTPVLFVQANDNGDLSNTAGSFSLTKVQIFVTSSADEVVLQVNQPASDVRSYQEQMKRVIMNSSSTANPISYVCIREITNSVEDGGQQTYTSSKVYLSAIGPKGNDTVIYPGSVLRDILQEQLKDDKTALAYQSLYVESIKTHGEDSGTLAFFKEEAVLAIFIICILLIFLAIVLLILACILISSSKRRKIRKLNAERNTFVEFVQEEPLQPIHSLNPVYQIKAPAPAYEEPPSDVYSVVQKHPKTMQTFSSVPVTPVIVSNYSLDPPEMPEAEPIIITEPIMSEEIPVTRQPPPADFFDPVPVIETEVVSDDYDDDDDDEDDSEPGYTDEIGDIIDAEIQDEDDDESPQSSPRSRPSSPDEYRIETNTI